MIWPMEGLAFTTVKRFCRSRIGTRGHSLHLFFFGSETDWDREKLSVHWMVSRPLRTLLGGTSVRRTGTSGLPPSSSLSRIQKPQTCMLYQKLQDAPTPCRSWRGSSPTAEGQHLERLPVSRFGSQNQDAKRCEHTWPPVRLVLQGGVCKSPHW